MFVSGRGAALAVIALCVLIGRVPVAAAHAVLLRAEPTDLCLLPGGESLPSDSTTCRAGAVLSQPPRVVRLVFNEPVQPIGRGLRVIGPDGRRVDQGSVGVAGAAVAVNVEARAPGTYRVVWSVISPDTHPDFGTMAFSVLRPGGVLAEGTPAGGGAAVWGTILGALAHLLHFAGYALGFGTLTAAWLAGRADPPSRASGAPDLLWRLTGIGIALLLLAEPIGFAAESVALGAAGGGADPAVVGAVLDSSFGRVLAQRLAAAILLWVLAGALQSGALRAAWTVPLLGAGLAFLDGQAVHASAVRPVWWGLGINAVHVGAMGLWGGTLALALLSRPAAAVGRLALAAGIAAVASGVVMAFQHLAGFRDFVANPYGRTLAVKICAVAAAAGLGWFGVRRQAARRLLTWEAAAMLVVFALAGVLVLLRPPVP
jgi:methionine-rich copper-binding protein CopC/putative copper export protein